MSSSQVVSKVGGPKQYSAVVEKSMCTFSKYILFNASY
jgi:hypothetical protein